MDESEYDDSNRAFLQAFLARGSLTFKDAKPVLAAIFSVHGKISVTYTSTKIVLRRSTADALFA